MEKYVLYEVTPEERELLYKMFQSQPLVSEKRSRTEKMYAYIKKHISFRSDHAATGK